MISGDASSSWGPRQKLQSTPTAGEPRPPVVLSTSPAFRHLTLSRKPSFGTPVQRPVLHDECRCFHHPSAAGPLLLRAHCFIGAASLCARTDCLLRAFFPEGWDPCWQPCRKGVPASGYGITTAAREARASVIIARHTQWGAHGRTGWLGARSDRPPATPARARLLSEPPGSTWSSAGNAALSNRHNCPDLGTNSPPSSSFIQRVAF